jgi:PAS domain S-box-containing protein
MNFLKPNSVKSKIFLSLSIAFISATAAAAALMFLVIRSEQKNSAEEKVSQITKNLSDRLKYRFENYISDIDLSVELFHPSNLNLKNYSDRQKAQHYLQKLLEKRSDFIQTLLIWETKIVQQKDSLEINGNFIGKSGKYIAVYKKNDEGKITNAMPEDYLDLINLSDYSEIRKNLKLYIGNPILMQTKGRNELVIPTAEPIVEGDRFYGIFETVCRIDFLKTEIDNSEIPYENAQIFLISDNGTILYSRNRPFLAGININDYKGTESVLVQDMQNETKLTTDNFTGSHRAIQFENSSRTWNLYVFIPNYSLTGKQSLIFNISVFISILLIVAALIISYYFIDKYFLPLGKLIISAKKIENGDIVPLPEINENDEFSAINNSFRKIIENLNEKAVIAKAIAAGDFTKITVEKSENDLLAKAINQISKNFSELNLINEKQRLEAQEQLWIRKGRFEIANAQRNSDNVQNLADNIIQSVVKYVDAALGALYFFEDDGSDFPYIQLASAFAFDNSKHLEKEFYPGEGLVGTCALERKKIILRNIPKDYVKIASGMGNTAPEFLMILPVFFEEQITAFIEIGFYKEPENYKIDFIEQLTESIGSWISTTKVNEQTNYLLEQSRTHAQELSAKETELGKRIDELRKIQEERAQDEADRESLLNAVNHTIMTIEYTIDGIFLTANDTYLNAMGYKLEDLKGYNVLDLVKDQREELESVIRDVRKGKYIERLMKRYTGKGEPKWLFSTYTPYYNVKGEITKIIYFAFDVSEMVQSEFEYQDKINHLEQTVRASDNKIKDLEGKLNEYKKTEEDLLGKILEKVREIKELKKIIKTMNKD